MDAQTKTVYFGAGCFWGIEHEFQHMDGVLNTEVGYMGGHVQNPTYEQVCGGKTGHIETTKVEFDPEIVSYEKLLDKFWEIHDSTQLNRQGPDVGFQYRSVIFYTDDEKKKTAEKSKEKLEASGKYDGEVVTAIEQAKEFYPAEEYHQDYFHKTGQRSCHA